MKKCEKCGISVRSGRLCQTCRKYERLGGVWHPLPPYGDVRYDSEGRPICHVCGMALDKLIEHTKRKHGLDTLTYREKFGLMRKNLRLTSPKYADKMKSYSDHYQTHVKNFADVQQGRKPNGRRLITKWSPQERELRRPAQSKIAKIRWANETPESINRQTKIWTKNLPNKKGAAK